VLSVFVVGYAVAVIWHVATTGDIGLRCVFGVRIREVAPFSWSPHPLEISDQLRGPVDAAVVFQGAPPRTGDVLEMVGGRAIRHYTDYVRAMRDVRGRIGQPVEVRWQDSLTGEHLLGHVVIERPAASTYLWSLVWFLQEMLIFAVGARVYWIRPRDQSARIFFWLCVVTVVAFMGGYHWSRIVDEAPLIFTFAAFALFVPVTSLHFYLVFPRANPIWVRHERRLRWLLYGVPVVCLAAMWSLMFWSRVSPDPGQVEYALGLLRQLAFCSVVAAFGIFVLCLICLISSYQSASSRSERNQVQWILLATLLSLVPLVWLFVDILADPSRLGLTRSAWPMFIVSLLYTFAYALSITRYKLLQAEAIWNRSVIFLVVSVVAGIVYSGCLILGALVVGERLKSAQVSLGTVVAFTTALVLLGVLEAARYRFQAALERRFHKEKYKFDQAMRRMSVAVGSLVDRQSLGRKLLEAAADVLRVEWGAVYLAEEPGQPLRLAGSCGPEPEEHELGLESPLLERLAREPGTFRVSLAMDPVTGSDAATDVLIALGGEIAVPLHAEGNLVGLIVLGPKWSGLPYEDEEAAFVGALGSVATMALHSADIQHTLSALNRELRDKVEKIAEQQRRILILQDQLTGQMAETQVIGTGVETVEHGAAELALTPAPAPARGSGPDPFHAIKGSSRAMRELIQVARKVANSPSAVLIRGESGTGKELLAEAIHRASPRADGPFVKVHCAALSQTLLESELFGHVKGAYTGADRDRVGRFQQADGGTLFLDEIGDINWEVQTKLLRVLQEMSFERVGSSQPIRVDVRILAATHQNLDALIRANRFREDLYYRLNVITIPMPPLRERKEDIFELAVHFLTQYARRVRKPITHLDDAAIELLVAYDWPGNIRQLENVIERAVVLSDGPAITAADLPVEIRRPQSGRPGVRAARGRAPVLSVAGVPAGTDEAGNGNRPVRLVRGAGTWAREGGARFEHEEADPEALGFERERLVDALREARGVKSEAARLLGMPRSTFFSKLKKHGLA
jgi:transcriptional regulator with GAF, ATPase, and Fis domain